MFQVLHMFLMIAFIERAVPVVIDTMVEDEIYAEARASRLY
jgi:hypothetical protein